MKSEEEKVGFCTGSFSGLIRDARSAFSMVKSALFSVCSARNVFFQTLMEDQESKHGE